MKVTGLACALALGGALSYLYVIFLFAFLFRADISELDSLQLVIIITLLGRLVFVLHLSGPRSMKDEPAVTAFILFSLEAYIFLGFMVFGLLFGGASFFAIGLEIFSTWVAGVMCVVLPYTILSISIRMAKNRELIGVLFPAATDFAFLVFLVGVTSQATKPPSFGNLFQYLISSARSDLASGVSPLPFASSVLVPSAVVYCSLLVYATLPRTANGVSPRVALTLPLLSALVAIAWILNPARDVSSTLLSFTAPTLVVVALLWWFLRR